MKKYFFILSFFLFACGASRLLMPSTADLPAMQKKVPGLTYEKVVEGFKLYKVHCSSCHALYRPNQYTAEKWGKVLPEMFSKVKLLNEEQKGLIKDYLHALSK